MLKEHAVLYTSSAVIPPTETRSVYWRCLVHGFLTNVLLLLQCSYSSLVSTKLLVYYCYHRTYFFL